MTSLKTVMIDWGFYELKYTVKNIAKNFHLGSINGGRTMTIECEIFYREHRPPEKCCVEAEYEKTFNDNKWSLKWSGNLFVWHQFEKLLTDEVVEEIYKKTLGSIFRMMKYKC